MMKYLIRLFLCMIPMQYLYADGSGIFSQEYRQQQYWVFQPQDLSKLRLALQTPQNKFLHSFKAWQKQLGSCQQLSFAMNAGMFHPNYSPVGLYIGQGRQKFPLNQNDGFGNFFLKPNGVLAWHKDQAFIGTTEQWLESDFKAEYATQSGPMLVVNGKIHPKFLPDSDSKTIRNGVGIKEGKLYFVMSHQAVNFYQFATFFRDGLQAEQALYLDGSISSLYAPNFKRHDRAIKLGTMVGYIEPDCNH